MQYHVHWGVCLLVFLDRSRRCRSIASTSSPSLSRLRPILHCLSICPNKSQHVAFCLRTTPVTSDRIHAVVLTSFDSIPQPPDCSNKYPRVVFCLKMTARWMSACSRRAAYMRKFTESNNMREMDSGRQRAWRAYVVEDGKTSFRYGRHVTMVQQCSD